GSDSSLFDKEARKAHIVWETKPSDVRHHVIRPARGKRPEASSLKRGNQQIASIEIRRGHSMVVRIRQGESHGCGFLKRRWSTDRQEIVNFADRGRDRG